MKRQQPEHFTVPDQVYQFGDNYTLRPDSIPDEIYKLNQELNERFRIDPEGHYQSLLDMVTPPVVKGGSPFLFAADAGHSSDTAVVVNLPYEQPIIPTSSVEGEKPNGTRYRSAQKIMYLFECLKALDVRDEGGRTLPVIGLPNVSVDFKPEMSEQEAKDLVRGDMSPFVKNATTILQEGNFGRLHLLGYSAGASVTHAMAARAVNFDILSANLAEPPTYRDRSLSQLLRSYLGFEDPNWAYAGLSSSSEVKDIMEDKWLGDMAKDIAFNGSLRVAQALRRGTMLEDLKTAAKSQGVFPLSLTWHQNSRLTADLEQYLFSAASPYSSAFSPFKNAAMLRKARASGTAKTPVTHMVGENVQYFGTMMADHVKWATDRLTQVAAAEADPGQ
jgi:hypothetical protein